MTNNYKFAHSAQEDAFNKDLAEDGGVVWSGLSGSYGTENSIMFAMLTGQIPTPLSSPESFIKFKAIECVTPKFKMPQKRNRNRAR